jgi:putative ABC transport system substrate-binding protein
MSRRDIVCGLGALAGAAFLALAGRAQTPPARRVALVGAASFWDDFVRGLHELGYRDGREVVFEVLPVGEPGLAAELARRSIDVIVASSYIAGGLAAKKATSETPIVIVRMADPVGVGLVATLARPGGNVTGLSTQSAELMAKRLELLKETIPTVARVVIVGIAGNPVFRMSTEQARGAARSLGIVLDGVAVDPRDYARAFAEIQKTAPDALLVTQGIGDQSGIADFALRNRLATISLDRDLAEAGILLSYGPNYADLFRRAAAYVDKILKGAKPADLPVEQPTKFELVVNLKTAKALGVTIPQSILLRADEVIE